MRLILDGQGALDFCCTDLSKMPRLNKHFFDEVAKVVSYRAEQNKSAPLLRAANGESKDSIDGEPKLTEALWSKAKNDRVNVLSTCFIEVCSNNFLCDIGGISGSFQLSTSSPLYKGTQLV